MEDQSNSRASDWERWEVLEFESYLETQQSKYVQETIAINSHAAMKGRLRSGRLLMEVAEIWRKFALDAIQKAILLRRTSGTNEPALLNDLSLAKLQKQIGNAVGFLQERLEQSQPFKTAPERAKTSVLEPFALVHVNIDREIQKLRLERDLGVMEPKGSQFGSVVINVSNSQIAAFNLGSVIQEVTATVNALQNAGNANAANALKQIAEAVTADDAVGDQRKDVLEALTTLGEQAALPAEKRKRGVIEPLLKNVKAVLSTATTAAEAWQKWGQPLWDMLP